MVWQKENRIDIVKNQNTLKSKSIMAKMKPINDEMYGWVSPSGTVQMLLIAPDIAMLLGITKIASKSGLTESAKQMSNKGFTIHRLKVNIENIEQVVMDGKLMADLMNL